MFAFSIRVLFVFIFLASSFFVSASVSAATRVELVVDEAYARRSVPWPVTTGVPFPRGALADEKHCRLLDDGGRERPLQSKVAATWDADRASVRWLTIDFVAEPGRTYALEFGDDVLREIVLPPLVTAGDDMVVNLGPLQVVFSRRGPAALEFVSLDLNGDRMFTGDEQIAGGSPDGDHRFVDQRGRAWSSVRDGAERTITLETNGPVRTCVRIDGWYTGPGGERVVAYRTRYHLFTGLSLMKVIDEFRVVGSTRDLQFRDIALSLALKLDGKSCAVKTAAGSVGDEHTLGVSSVQTTYRHYGNPESEAVLVERRPEWERIVHRAGQAGAWMQTADDRTAVTGTLRNFWQQFPKEWEATPSGLTLHLWSPRVDPLDFGEAGLRKFFGPAGEKYLLDWKSGHGSTPITDFFYYAGRHALERDGADGRGINKHHEVWYHFGRAGEATEGREYGELADRQPLCLATGAWNVGTGVFGPLAARPNGSPHEAIVDRIFELERRAQDDFGDYGWFLFGAGPHYSYQWDAEARRHYADPRRFEYHTYQRETQLWWCYLRSGERKFYDWCFPSEDHWVDIAVSHVPLKYSTEWRGGRMEEAVLHYPAGDWSIDSPLHYVRHHDTGEAWLRGASQYWGTYHRTLETTTLAYYLTGDERYNDVVEFWKNYWGALAGVRSDSADVKPWHRDQTWFLPTAPGEPTKSWAEMIRDYAPFQSGSRHQQTLFFNLATLYEHTWDPTIRQVLGEYAAAFIVPENPNGVWQCQDHHLPANADSPLLAHYWSPALWKYARASGDPRMPEVLRKYFTACVEADPYGEDVGIYSNNQIAWGWWFTRDPRHLAAARRELELLSPHAAPLEKPENLGGRIYNPYAPIKCLAAVPRLIAVLDDAEREGIAVPSPAPLEPQRTLIAVRSPAGESLAGALWGWDRDVQIFDASGVACGERNVVAHRSHRRPFDRALPGYEVFRTEFSAQPDDQLRRSVHRATNRWHFVSPRLETGIVELSAAGEVWCLAVEPVQISERGPWYWRRTGGATTLTLESARPASLQLSREGAPLAGRVVGGRLIVSLTELPAGAVVAIEGRGNERPWFRLADLPDSACWVSPRPPVGELPPVPAKLIAARKGATAVEPGPFVAGRFGQALLVNDKTEFAIPDEMTLPDGTVRRLSDDHQGSIEFWIRRLTDDRITASPRATVLDAGSISVSMPENVPLGKWCHVAVDWFPLPVDPQRSLVCVYVDGVDYGNYRSMYWEGYSVRPQMFPTRREWLKKFVVRAPPGTQFALDDVRVGRGPRHVDTSLEFGRAQTFNPDRFAPPTMAAACDDSTVILAPLDGDFYIQTSAGKPRLP